MIFFIDNGFIALCIILLIMCIVGGAKAVGLAAGWLLNHFIVVIAILTFISIFNVLERSYLEKKSSKAVAIVLDAIRLSAFIWAILDGVYTTTQSAFANGLLGVFDYFGFFIVVFIFAEICRLPFLFDRSDPFNNIFRREIISLILEIICYIVIYIGFGGW